jgi:hypothetical protein
MLSKFFDADPGWKKFGSGIRGWKKFGSGIWDKHPGSATLPHTLIPTVFAGIPIISCSFLISELKEYIYVSFYYIQA